MAAYNTAQALALQQYAGRTDNLSVIFYDMTEVIIQQAEAIKKLNRRVEYLEKNNK